MKSIIIAVLLGSTMAYSQDLDSVRTYINSTKIKHKDIVYNQVRLETGNLECINCSREVNNIFGFYYKKQFIKFGSWKDSVDYYQRWQLRHYKGGDYYDFLTKRGYATDTSYIKKLKQMK